MIAIIDTSVLVTLHHIDKIQYLNLLYNKVLVPLKVQEEFLKEDTDSKTDFIFKRYENNAWIEKCQSLHEDTYKILDTNVNMDDGEKEALSQYKAFETDMVYEQSKLVCILDEKEARRVAQNMNVQIYGTLYILARLHFHGIINYSEVTEKIKIKCRFGDNVIQAAFDKAQKDLGIAS